jgi:hypothetical protein
MWNAKDSAHGACVTHPINEISSVLILLVNENATSLQGSVV